MQHNHVYFLAGESPAADANEPTKANLPSVTPSEAALLDEKAELESQNAQMVELLQVSNIVQCFNCNAVRLLAGGERRVAPAA